MPNSNKKKTNTNSKDTEKTKKYEIKNKKVNKDVNKSEKTDKKDKKNKKEKKVKKHPKLWLAIKIIVILILLAVIVCGGVIAGVFFGVFGDDVKMTEEMLTITHLNSYVYDKDGNLLEELARDENRKLITLDDMPKYLKDAFISIEDERFESHNGVDIPRTLYATVTYILNGGESSFGGSTITQQLVKRITKEDEDNWTRKVKEMARAIQVERLISKDQILELYLNIIYLGGFGKNVHGVEVASNYYFNKSVKDLSIAESAYIAGINHAPNAYNPFEEDTDNTEKIKIRTKTVLDKMKELGKITEEEYNTATAEVDAGLTFTEGAIIENVYSYHTDAAIREIKEQLQEENGWSEEMAELYIYSGGLKIYTTQDTSIQEKMEEEMSKEKYISASRKNKDPETGEYKTTQAAMVIIDHETGKVVGCVGGLGEKTVSFSLNRATSQPKATGSSMKPLAVIVPGLEEGIITAGKVYDDIPIAGGFHNFSWDYNGLVTVRYAIETSLNIPAVQMMKQIGEKTAIKYLEEMGISTLVEADEAINGAHDEGLSLALGGLTKGITPLEVAAAYATIANDGVYIEPTFYTKIEDAEGNIVLEPKQETRRVMSEQNAYIAKSIVKQPVIGNGGTATQAYMSGMDVAAKTGTSNDTEDKWLCGFTPYYTAAVWFGYDQNETIRLSGNPAAQIWAGVMKPIHADLPGKRFEKPSNIVSASICKSSGLLATELCKNDQRESQVYSEIYVAGTTPKSRCNCHVELEVCEETNKLATEFCTNKVKKVFITRASETGWERAKDAEYMAPTEQCNVHTTKTETNTTNTIDTVNVTNTTNSINTTVTNTTNTLKPIENETQTNVIADSNSQNPMTNTVD